MIFRFNLLKIGLKIFKKQKKIYIYKTKKLYNFNRIFSIQFSNKRILLFKVCFKKYLVEIFVRPLLNLYKRLI